MTNSGKSAASGALAVAAGVLLGCASESFGTADPFAQADDNQKRVRDLYEARSREKISAFKIGAGDVLDVHVPAMPELERYTAHVAADGTVSLPLLGPIDAAGRSEAELRELLDRQLRAYMYDPRSTVVARESPSRQVGVMGAVQKPGFLQMTSPEDTLLDILAQAGGTKEGAATHVRLLPALQAGPLPTLSESAIEGRDSVTIDLSDAERSAGVSFLNLPLRPGDVIVVPERGAVQVTGWVRQPGSYPIAPGMTVLGSVVAAGGAHFGANPSSVSVARRKADGTNAVYSLDLHAIEAGTGRDLEVEPGDVVHVRGSPPRVAGWGVYRFLTDIISVGL